MDDFYAGLAPFSNFDGIAELSAYRAVPSDWVVLATDIQGSTAAIREGRYKDVNMLGAASITAVLNVAGEVELPYAFGGDGATILVPRSIATAATDALRALRRTSLEIFRLRLRVGVIPVADVQAEGHEILVRKYELSPRNHLAMFAGGGMACADRLLKDPANEERYVPREDPDGPLADLTGLSCRWSPLLPRGGRIAAFMVQSLAGDAVIRDLMAGLQGILGTGVETAAPANAHSLRFRWPPDGLWIEARATAHGGSLLLRYLWLLGASFLQFCAERLRVPVGDYDPSVYHEQMRSNTDYRKFDGTLRLVLDVTEDQANEIEAWLEEQYRNRRLIYGFHAAKTALMTCLVFSMEQGEHVHFVDGGDGGYAMASVGFKRRSEEITRVGGV